MKKAHLIPLGLLLLTFAGCSKTDKQTTRNIPADFEQMQKEYGDFDPQTLINKLVNSSSVWTESAEVLCTSKEGQTILLEGKTTASPQNSAGETFSFDFDQIYNLWREQPSPENLKGQAYFEICTMTYDPNSRTITTTTTSPDGETQQYTAKVLAFSGDAMMIEGSLCGTGIRTLTADDGQLLTYPEIFTRQILRAGTDDEFNTDWEDAVPIDIKRIQEQYGDFDPQTVMTTLQSVPIWIDDTVVRYFQDDAGMTHVMLAAYRGENYIVGGNPIAGYLFSNDVMRYFYGGDLETTPYYTDYDLQYDPISRTITATHSQADGTMIQYQLAILAMSNDAILLKNSDSYSDSSYNLEILHAGTLTDLNQCTKQTD